MAAHDKGKMPKFKKGDTPPSLSRGATGVKVIKSPPVNTSAAKTTKRGK